MSRPYGQPQHHSRHIVLAITDHIFNYTLIKLSLPTYIKISDLNICWRMTILWFVLIFTGFRTHTLHFTVTQVSILSV